MYIHIMYILLVSFQESGLEGNKVWSCEIEEHLTFNNVTDILTGGGQIRTYKGDKGGLFQISKCTPCYSLEKTYCTGYRYNRSSRNVSL